ncbi:MAG: enoyl-CoA hydratase/isomerase family protein [Bryobacteraceae bacterium]|nr:enoyl-CoA hydratase/isomerase family protein [Bryobacteraceae bacterium]
MSSPLEVSLEDRVLHLVLNRPEKKNALSAELCHMLIEALESANEDEAVGSILLQSRGDVFCSGMDLMEASADNTVVHERLFTVGLSARKPIVAAVGGHALGGGLGLVANAHIAIAAQGCSFGLTEIRVGMWPYVIWRSIVAAIGERRTTALALTGRIFSVNEALQWGLVHEVAPAFEMEERALATAIHLAQSSAQAIRLGLDYVRESRGLPSEVSGELAQTFRKRSFESSDYLEAVAAFREKRVRS